MTKQIRTRLAPSPTGYLHIGVLRTALYAFLFAKQNGGKFILRIEDTDQERLVDGAVKSICDSLKWAGLDYDEGPDVGGEFGPYIQSERKEIYNEYIKKLVDDKKAYYCFCSKERLEELRKDQEATKQAIRYDGCCRELTGDEIKQKLSAGESYVIRQKMPENGIIVFDDAVYGKITVNNNELEDQILMKSDGFPTYNFANVVDDHFMEISHVIRGSEFLSSTPKFNLLYEAFGWEPPKYIHAPPIMKDEHKKLSKREGDASVDDFIKKGYTKEAIINYIALLGWNPGTDKEIFSITELIKEFSIEKIHKNSAIFDYKKLNWLNGHYLREMSLEKFHEFVKGWYDEALPLTEGEVRRGCGEKHTPPLSPPLRGGELRDGNLMKISKILHQRLDVPSDIPEMIDFISELPDYDIELYTHKKMKTDTGLALKVLQQTLKLFTEFTEEAGLSWNEENIKKALFKQCENMKLKTGQVMWPVRIALSGKQFTPGGAIEIADVFGRDESLRRIKLGIAKLI